MATTRTSTPRRIQNRYGYKLMQNNKVRLNDYLLVCELDDDTTQSFKCSLSSPPHITYDNYEKFWEYHYPASSPIGISDADWQTFSDLFANDEIVSMYYEEA